MAESLGNIMLVRGTRIIWAAAALTLLPLLNASAANPGPTAEQQRAWLGQLQSEQDKARDRLIAANVSGLLNDPHTPVIGSPQADVAIIEFFDYTCPYCKAVEPKLEKLLKDDKRVKLVVKEFPILAPESLVGAKAALASMK